MFHREIYFALFQGYPSEIYENQITSTEQQKMRYKTLNQKQMRIKRINFTLCKIHPYTILKKLGFSYAT